MLRSFKSSSVGLLVLAIILSNAMSAKVAFEYSNMLWGIKCAGFSAPANVAFVFAIPYLIGIIICLGLFLVTRRKSGLKEL